MNKFKKFVSVGIAAALTLTSLPTVVFAEDEFLSATELISATVEMAANNVQSDTYADSLIAVEAKVTTSGDEVFYDGNSIGFWFSDTPNIIYKDAEKTTIALQTDTTTGGYTADPTLLCEIMTDFNNGLVSTAVPTTTDWSKIIGKYDVTLGDIVIPADRWFTVEPSTDPFGDLKTVNVTRESGITVGSQVGYMGYIIDSNGDLWLHDSMTVPRPLYNKYGIYNTAVDNLSGSTGHWGGGAMVSTSDSTVQFTPDRALSYNIEIGVKIIVDNDVTYYDLSSYITDISHTSAGASVPQLDKIIYRNIKSPTEVFDTSAMSIDKIGFFYMTDAELNKLSYVVGSNSYNTAHIADLSNMYNKQSSSKLTIGNTTLEQRLAKLVSLAPTDTITVSETGWTVNGIDNLDTYVGTQSVIEPGAGTDVSAVADIEAACFDVIIPTNLPIYVDDHGQVSVADNASIKNKSSLAVKITDVEIKAKPDIGWTLVDTSPSQARDAKEFTFTTSLTTGTELNVDETITFTYDAQISPTTEGYTSLDLATVTVVVDWAE